MATTITDRLIDNRLAQGIIAPVRQVWMAALGTYSIVERKGGELFRTLYQRGEEVTAQASQQAKEVTGRLEERFENIQTGVFSNNLNKLEKAFQKRVMWGLRRLGIPSHKDLQHLARKVEALQQDVIELIRLDQTEQAAAVKKSKN